MNTFTRNITAALSGVAILFGGASIASAADAEPQDAFMYFIGPDASPEIQLNLQFAEIELMEEAEENQPKAKNMNKLIWDPCLEIRGEENVGSKKWLSSN